jgi:two-component system, cell cycle sensor histidine kinase and response regulator CckA
LLLLERYRRLIDLLLVDVVLPSLSGPELAARAKDQYPELLILYVSAYDQESVRLHGVDPDQMPFLPKPYEPSHLVQRESRRPSVRPPGN